MAAEIEADADPAFQLRPPPNPPLNSSIFERYHLYISEGHMLEPSRFYVHAIFSGLFYAGYKIWRKKSWWFIAGFYIFIHLLPSLGRTSLSSRLSEEEARVRAEEEARARAELERARDEALSRMEEGEASAAS